MLFGVSLTAQKTKAKHGRIMKFISTYNKKGGE